MMSSLKVYAIPNCNTVKKALDWLKAHKVSYVFHDYKKLGITATLLQQWSKQVGWESLLNKKGATWAPFLMIIRAVHRTALIVLLLRCSTHCARF
jgi:arsenate reductase-like glutaredoxin family protein